MRTESPKKQINRNKLLAAFNEYGALTTEEMMKILNVNQRKTVKEYRDELEQQGYIFETVSGKPPKFRLKAAESYEKLTANIMRKYLIMQELQENPINKEDLIYHFTLSSILNEKTDKNTITDSATYQINNHNDCASDLTLIDINQTKFYSLIKELIDENNIILASDNQKYYLTGTTVPLVLNANWEILDEISYQMSNIPTGSPYYELLHTIYQKTDFLLNGISDNDYSPSETYENNYIVYGKKHNALVQSKEIIDSLEKNNYRKNTVKITYVPKSGNKMSVLCNTGMLVYCVDKDILYLYGEETGDTEFAGTALHINVSSIISVESATTINPCYRSPQYMQMFNSMFAISSEPETKVKIEFDAFPSIMAKLEILNCQRPFSRLEFQTSKSKILYTDTIRGTDDFASFLRQFGKSVKVLEPSELADKLLFSATETLKLYEETENEI